MCHHFWPSSPGVPRYYEGDIRDHGYRRAERLLILTATYGDGDPPASANRFLARLERLTDARGIPFAVLGFFGDRQFPQYCGFANQADAALAAKRWTRLLALDTIDRQSLHEFARWVRPQA